MRGLGSMRLAPQAAAALRRGRSFSAYPAATKDVLRSSAKAIETDGMAMVPVTADGEFIDRA